MVDGRSSVGTIATPVKVSKKERFREIQEKLALLGVDPIEILAMIASDPDNNPELKMSAAKELASYLFPKRKAIDTTLTMDGDFAVQVIKFGKPNADNSSS